jgi:hypothetical protein
MTDKDAPDINDAISCVNHCAVQPPSTLMHVPRIWSAALEQRKTAVAPIGSWAAESPHPYTKGVGVQPCVQWRLALAATTLDP